MYFQKVLTISLKQAVHSLCSVSQNFHYHLEVYIYLVLFSLFASLRPHRSSSGASSVSLGHAGEQIILVGPLGCVAAVPVVIAG